MVKVMSHSNPLVNENRSLRRTNALAAGIAGFLAIVSTLSVESCRRNASTLEKSQQENKVLRASAEYFQKDAANTAMENQSLRRYANDAHIFANSIQFPYPDLVDGKTAEEEEASFKEYEKAQKQYDDACKTLGIDQDALLRLKQGWQLQR